MIRAFLLAALVGHLPCAQSHAWVWDPISKNEMEYNYYQSGMPQDFRYEPQTSNHGNGIGVMSDTGGAFCGANDGVTNQGLGTWQKWFDAAGVEPPRSFRE